MVPSDKERALVCEACDVIEYPKISPVVIVGVTNGDKILVTKYAGRAYTNYALIAGFVEIGETLEDTIRREVMEEAGVKVKNIRYYKSQPWGFSDSILAGFFAELDGDDTIELDQEELCEGRWIKREDIVFDKTKRGAFDTSDISLTSELIRAFYHKEKDFF